MNKIQSNGELIQVSAKDFSCKFPSDHKLELLYYNNINRNGEVLSSLVYNSGLRVMSDDTDIVYSPLTLYKNTDIEKQYSIAGDSNVWRNNISYTDGTLLKDNTYSATNAFARFDVVTDFSLQKYAGMYVYDGWYSHVTLRITSTAITQPGAIRYNGVELQYYDNSNSWRSIYDIDSSVPIYKIDNTKDMIDNKDFFVITKAISYYKKYLDMEMEFKWSPSRPVIGSKIKVIEELVENKDFGTAQHLINSLNTQSTIQTYY